MLPGRPGRQLLAPTAVFDIDFLGRGSVAIHNRVGQAIAILRLFKVGSVKYILLRMGSDSITDISGSGELWPINRQPAREHAKLGTDDTVDLQGFWQVMERAMPEHLYALAGTKSDFLSIAYARFCDALLENGLTERRIANAVMGLESLFLRASEQQELTYRLGLRVGRLLSVVGYDALTVKEVVKEGYRVRSAFVHGAAVDRKSKAKIVARFGNLEQMLVLLLDCLRISLVAVVCGAGDKERLVKVLDDSLLDREKESKLASMLKGLPKSPIAEELT